MHFHVYALDLRGHGKSGRTGNNYKIQDYVPDVKDFIEKRIEKPAIIIGHSLGGMIAMFQEEKGQFLQRRLMVKIIPGSNLGLLYATF